MFTVWSPAFRRLFLQGREERPPRRSRRKGGTANATTYESVLGWRGRTWLAIQARMNPSASCERRTRSQSDITNLGSTSGATTIGELAIVVTIDSKSPRLVSFASTSVISVSAVGSDTGLMTCSRPIVGTFTL